MPDNTQRIDDCECIYCHHVFDGKQACNSNMDAGVVECPKCGREMGVSLSIEYLCYSVDQDIPQKAGELCTEMKAKNG